MKLFVTIADPSVERAIASIQGLPARVNAVELRLDTLDRFDPSRDFDRVRRSTKKELIATRRSRKGGATRADDVVRALESGFDLADVELGSDLPGEVIQRYSDRLILSIHDFEACGEIETVLGSMEAFGIERLKIAVTPSAVKDNLRLLGLLGKTRPKLTVIGMGSRGLYSRVAAPFLGSEMIFVAPSRDSIAAPGQLTLDDAVAIFSDSPQRAAVLFAIAGNPAAHSRSPQIHNAIFRERQIPAAYTILECEEFAEAAEALMSPLEHAPRGLSITAPFKESAWQFAEALGSAAMISERATSCRAVNTLARLGGRIIADNTDVDGFDAAIALVEGPLRRAAVIGAGGTARAALYALGSAGFTTAIYNRTLERAKTLAGEFNAIARGIDELQDAEVDLVINTLPRGVELELPSTFNSGVYVDLAYGASRASVIEAGRRGIRLFDGLTFLEAQARGQSELFIRAASE